MSACVDIYFFIYKFNRIRKYFCEKKKNKSTILSVCRHIKIISNSFTEDGINIHTLTVIESKK